MHEIKCPKCGEAFTVDEAGYAAIARQVRDKEFKTELNSQLQQAVDLAVTKAIAKEKDTALEKEKEITNLKAELDREKKDRESAINSIEQKYDFRIKELNHQNEKNKIDWEKETDKKLSKKDDAIKELREELERAKDFKAKLSTKLIGEDLEQHCEIEFNRLRSTAFRNATFEKDNDIKQGSKGDYIYRDFTDDGIEYISIMFEMKNEADETKTKHKNSDFFDKLDKDRNKKECEFAVLVSTLEAENELYSGITDVSYKYNKMFVVRPQFFIPIISLLRNAAASSIEQKRALENKTNQDLDMKNFMNNLALAQKGFTRNVDLAKDHFNNVINEIDKTIRNLEKIKEGLQKSGKQLRLASEKLNDIDAEKLAKDSPSLLEEIKSLKEDM